MFHIRPRNDTGACKQRVAATSRITETSARPCTTLRARSHPSTSHEHHGSRSPLIFALLRAVSVARSSRERRCTAFDPSVLDVRGSIHGILA